MDAVSSWVLNRQINCLPPTERTVFGVLLGFFGGLVPMPCPLSVYSGLWSPSIPYEGVRERAFWSTWQLGIVTIEDVDFVVSGVQSFFTLYWAWVTLYPSEATKPCSLFPFD